jgi:hypothetical protein
MRDLPHCHPATSPFVSLRGSDVWPQVETVPEPARDRQESGQTGDSFSFLVDSIAAPCKSARITAKVQRPAPLAAV